MGRLRMRLKNAASTFKAEADKDIVYVDREVVKHVEVPVEKIVEKIVTEVKTEYKNVYVPFETKVVEYKIPNLAKYIIALQTVAILLLLFKR